MNGKILQPVAGSTQVFYSSLTLRGDMGNPLLGQSSSEGQEAFFSLDASGTQDIVAVDVADNDASGGQSLIAGSLSGTESMDLGNNSNWVLALPPIEFVPVPTLSRWALMILSLVLVSAGLRRRHAVLNGNKWAI